MTLRRTWGIYGIAIAVLLAAAAPDCAYSQDEFVTKKDLQKIFNKLEALEKENRELKKTNAALAGRIEAIESKGAAEAGGEQLSRKVAELDETVQYMSKDLDMITTKALMDSIKITGELRTRADWFDYRETLPVYNIFGKKVKRHHINDQVHGLMSNRLRLNLFAKASDSLQFHGRLTMYRNWNDEGEPAFPARNYMNYSRSRSDTDLQVERAYVDYFFQFHPKLPMALTFGRLPTTDGMPTNLRENTPRKSTYPGLAFDGEADGIGLSVGLSDLVRLPNAAFRYVYIRNVRDNDNELYRPNDYDLGSIALHIFQFETGLPDRWKLGDTLFVTNFMYLPHLSGPDVSLRVPYLRPVGSVDDHLGSVWKLTFFVESKRFMGSWFDWFAGWSYLGSDGSGRGHKWGLANIPLTSVGLYSSDGNTDKSAYAIHVGTRVNLPIAMLNEPKLGIEYNKGTKYWFGFNEGSEDPLHKLNVRGEVWDFYYLQPINKHFLFRMGYTMVDEDHGGYWVYGDRTDIDRKIKNLYLLLDARF